MLFGQMVSVARETLNLSLRDLGEVVRASAATIHKIEKMNHVPRDGLVEALINALSLDSAKAWEQVVRQRAAPYQSEISSDPFDVLLQTVPIVGKVTAGALIEAPEWEDGGYPTGSGFDHEQVPLRPEEAGLYGLAVDGDSMEPVFGRGDYVFAAPNKEARNNCYAVVRLVSGEVLLKKVTFQDKTIILLSANTAYAPISVKRREIAYIHPITIHRLSS